MKSKFSTKYLFFLLFYWDEKVIGANIVLIPPQKLQHIFDYGWRKVKIELSFKLPQLKLYPLQILDNLNKNIKKMNRTRRIGIPYSWHRYPKRR